MAPMKGPAFLETVLQSNKDLYECVRRFLAEENGQIQNFQWFKLQVEKVYSHHLDEPLDISDDERRGSWNGLTRKITKISRERKFAVQQRLLEMKSSTGRVQMRFTSSKQSGELLNTRVLYSPAAHVQPSIRGLALSCAQGLLPNRIERSLSTFQVHSRASGLVTSIEIGDLEGVKGYFSTRKAHPNDRDEDGDSLLMVSIVHKSAGNSALCCLLDEIAGTAEGTEGDDWNSEAIDLALRLFINGCGSESGVVLEHYTDLGTITLVRSDAPMRRLLLTGDCDLEEEDGFGRSALLACVEGVRRRHLAEMIEMFLHFGANPHAIDNDSAGILHFILRTTSACNRAHSQRSLSLPIKDILAKLLSRSCDPNSMDQNGITPSDLALGSSAWQIWCDALSESGLDPKEVIEKDDRQNCLRITTTLIDQRHKKWTERTTSTEQQILESTVMENMPHPICYYCELPGEWIPMKPPFDHYGSYLVKIGDSFAHAAFPNHTDGGFCKNALELNTCKRKSHGRDGDCPFWCSREISIRKHVAYRLWKERSLFTSSQAYSWASGLTDVRRAHEYGLMQDMTEIL
ncbi:hypothetical protein EJ04DRAFT_530226 [Polyplosphaeria fusca]|uniref:Clr5 domain-containing protein n=1 Tax=Polyplosphaeria fusca TaxID=682080 RepID=A0A9P4UVT5_9PLEO|nr:hypothetical protein EJ04DRAFT_530226 [Polyplosphaeria fusca]